MESSVGYRGTSLMMNSNLLRPYMYRRLMPRVIHWSRHEWPGGLVNSEGAGFRFATPCSSRFYGYSIQRYGTRKKTPTPL